MSAAPARRGPKKREFTRTEEQLLRYIAGETAVNGGVCCTKQELARMLNRHVRTIDRLVKDLRERGLIQTEMRRGEDGAQLPSRYRTVASDRSGMGGAL